MFFTIQRVGTRITSTSMSALRPGMPASQIWPATFNLDDVVDTKDYIVWRANLNKTLTQSDFTLWRANFAKTITNRPIAGGVDFENLGSGLGITSVPEPSAGFFVLSSCVIAGWYRRRGLAHAN